MSNVKKTIFAPKSILMTEQEAEEKIQFADSETNFADFASGFSGSESNLDWNIIIER